MHSSEDLPTRISQHSPGRKSQRLRWQTLVRDMLGSEQRPRSPRCQRKESSTIPRWTNLGRKKLRNRMKRAKKKRQLNQQKEWPEGKKVAEEVARIEPYDQKHTHQSRRSTDYGHPISRRCSEGIRPACECDLGGPERLGNDIDSFITPRYRGKGLRTRRVERDARFWRASAVEG